MLSRIGNSRSTYLELHDGPGLPCMGEMLTSPDVAGNALPWLVLVNPAGPDGPVVAGGPVGPCETPSPSSEESQDPLEHAVLIHADPAGQHAAVGTLSPSDCYPAGPAGPYVAGGPDGPDDYLQVLEPFEHLVLDHADPAGQHADIQDTVGSLEHSVVATLLDGRPMEGITDPELLEHPLKLPDTTLDGGLVEKISDWEPVASPVPDTTLDGRLMEGTTNLEHSVLVGSLDSGLMAGMSSLNHWSSRFLIRCWSHDLVKESRRRSQIGSRWHIWFWTLPWTVDLWRGLPT